ncbi:MAG: hydantoinase/oxoprolinase family protein [Acidimicrobiia bacterium]|nr:hydantoinase/oxoprolinase family protein [Acidimicrobiia bacterium]
MVGSWVGTDSGGTFTDVVAADGRVAKVLSTPADPALAVGRALDAVGGDRPAVLAHGTTVATNALLEGQGAPVALVATAGFEDLIEIARQDRPSLYDTFADRPVPLVARHRRVGIDERVGARGEVLRVPALEGLVERVAALDAEERVAVAVCLLHADLEPAHERLVCEALRAAGLDVTASHEVSPEFREYERTVTTVVNAALRPRCRAYLRELDALADDVLVLSSAGGLVPVVGAAETPAALLLSGPAGGVLAGAAAARANGFPDAITFDMGGTSTDVCLVLDGRPAPAGVRTVGGYPVRLPSLDVHTIGAGGGSIAHVDAGGALVVGPRSAGAEPGPACYGRGGLEPTVTDADVALGRIPADAVLGDLGTLDAAAAASALGRVGVTAEGVVQVVDANMELALRQVSVQRGVDPRRLALVAFGGAGPLHAASLADALGMAAVVVPARAGVLSAAGILAAPRQRDLVRSWPTPRAHGGLGDALAALAREAAALVQAGGVVQTGGVGEAGPAEPEVSTSVDCRYAGQSHELTVSDVGAFAEEHRRRNGYVLDDVAIEVVAMRASARLASPVRLEDLPAAARRPAGGPAVVVEADCTIWVPEGWAAAPGAAGALVLRRVGAS